MFNILVKTLNSWVKISKILINILNILIKIYRILSNVENLFQNLEHYKLEFWSKCQNVCHKPDFWLKCRKFELKSLTLKDIRSNALWNLIKILEVRPNIRYLMLRLGSGRGDFKYFDQTVRDFNQSVWDFNQNIQDFDQHFRDFDQNLQISIEMFVILTKKFENLIKILFSFKYRRFVLNFLIYFG